MEHSLASPFQLYLPSDVGQAECYTLHLREGMVLHYSVLHFYDVDAPPKTVVPIATITEQWREPMFCMYRCEKGELLFSDTLDSDEGGDVMFGGKECYITYAQESRALLHIARWSGNVVVLSRLMLTKSLIEELLGHHYASLLLDSLRLNAVPSAALHRAPQAISKLLALPNINQPMDRLTCLSLQARVLDYFAALLKMMVRHARSKDDAATFDDRLQHLHDMLLQHEGKIPPIHELAKRYNFSVRTLQAAFVQRYGSTISAYITAQRLQQAHRKLLESDLPMKIISRNLGYSHVNHFITAFSRHFGYSPGSVRKTASLKKVAS